MIFQYNPAKTYKVKSWVEYCVDVYQEDEIPQHFGDCLGGLISMFAQNMKLELKTAENVTVKSVLSKYPQTHYEDQLRHVELKLGDMTSEERKDLLFVLTMAACTGVQ